MAALVSAAQRRKQRRLRSWWRHEQQSIAAVLATVTHHSFDQVGTANAALRGQKTGTSTRPGPAEFFELYSEDGRPGGMRPRSLLELEPQGKPEQHTGSGYELVLALAAPVLQARDDAVAYDFLHELPVLQEQMIVQEIPASAGVCRATQPMDVEQVLDVPVLHIDVEDRDVGRPLGYLEQMGVPVPLLLPSVVFPGFGSLELVVDVPVPLRVHTSLSDVSEEVMDQVVDIPVPHRVHASLSGVSDEVMEQVVDVPVPHRAHALQPDVSVEAMEQMVDVPGFHGDAPHAHAPRSADFSAASLDTAEEQFYGVFRTFPRRKKSATVASQSTAELGAQSSSSTPAAYGPDDLVFPRMLLWQSEDTFFCRGHVWCVRLEPSLQKYYFFRKDEERSQWQPPWLP